MAELVREDEPHRARVAVLDERVEEDDASRAAEPGHVRVLLARPPACVGDEHVLDRHARAHRELAQRARELFVLERREAVEDGSSTTGATNVSRTTSTEPTTAAASGHQRGEPAREAHDA